MHVSLDEAPLPSASGGLLARVTLTAALGGFLLGYTSAVISGVLGSIEVNLIDPLGLAETSRNTLAGFAVSSLFLGCVCGALLAGWLGRQLGRKAGLLIAALLFLISGIGCALPELGIGPLRELNREVLAAFIVYRILCGLAVGIVSMLAPLYIAELATPERRGRLVTFYQLAAVLGFVSVYFSNWFIASLGDEQWLHAVGWRLMLGSSIVPAAIFLILLLPVPDTPRSLIARGRSDEALAALRRLIPVGEIRQAFEDMRRSHDRKDARLLAFGIRVVVIGLVFSVFQQFVGINAVLYYSPLMFRNLGASTTTALLLTAVTAAVNMGFTFVAMFTVDSWGRKPLLILGALIMAAAMIALGVSFASGSIRVIALICVSVYLAAFTFSWGPVSAILLAEMFPSSIKDKAMAIAVAAQWTAGIVAAWSFRILDGNTTLNTTLNHGFAYLLYGGICLLAAFFVLRFIPETKGKSLEAIDALWK